MKSVKTPVTVTAERWYDFGGGHGLPEHVTVPGAPETTLPGEAVGESRQTELEHAVHAAHTPAMIASLIVAGLGILVAFLVYMKKMVDVERLAQKLRPLYLFLLNKWYFDEIYEKWIVVPFVLLTTRALAWFDNTVVDGAVNGAAKITVVASSVSGWFDKYVVDGLVNLTAYVAGFSGLVFRKFQTGRVQTYIVFVVLGIVVLFYVFY
jgi:NADH-quinone oxidoreductase subunit L